MVPLGEKSSFQTARTGGAKQFFSPFFYAAVPQPFGGVLHGFVFPMFFLQAAKLLPARFPFWGKQIQMQIKFNLFQSLTKQPPDTDQYCVSVGAVPAAAVRVCLQNLQNGRIKAKNTARHEPYGVHCFHFIKKQTD